MRIWPPKHLTDAHREEWEYVYGRPRRRVLFWIAAIAVMWAIGYLNLTS